MSQNGQAHFKSLASGSYFYHIRDLEPEHDSWDIEHHDSIERKWSIPLENFINLLVSEIFRGYKNAILG